MADLERRQLNRHSIEAHLKSAVTGLTPNVLERIDLSTPQMTGEELRADTHGEKQLSPVIVMRRRIRVIGSLAVACLCMIITAGGVYSYQNGRVDSVIGIDVNPSVELSVNKKNRVLEAQPLNEDAEDIMEDMDLKGVDLNVAVNAVIGSMVTHGYLDDLDNAILVTVSNDSISKATSLRSTVVSNIHSSLEENKVNAVVYDQQVIEEDNVKTLAGEYDISYGKAYFLKELIDQNPSLTTEDMAKLAPLTMEEIAREITERSYAVGGHTGISEDKTTVAATEPTTTQQATATAPATEEETTTVPETTTAPVQETVPVKPTQERPTQPPAAAETIPMTTEVPTTEAQEPVIENKLKIDYVDYSNGVVTVNFKTRVKWKNPTVSVKDDGGNTFSAMVGDTDSSSCEIHVSGLEGDTTYTFVLGGISPKNGKQTTVKGTFETPVIGNGQANEDPTDPPQTQESQESKPAEPSSTEAATAASGEMPAESAESAESSGTEMSAEPSV